ncbi:MAG: hypothetical protein J5I47_01840 [Vicingus serpentipes]|nr:hypothetical protein [Vicingus serpentipes]
MAIKKSKLKKLSKELSHYNIRSNSISSAAKHFGLTEVFIRYVLNGIREDNHGIIEYLIDCVVKEKSRVEKVLNKIDQL